MAWYRGVTPPLVLAIIVAFIILFSYFYPGTFVDQLSSTIVNWVIIIGALMIWTGLINLLRFSVREVRRKVPGRWYLALFQVCLIAVMLISGFGEGPGSTAKGAKTVIMWLYNNYYIWAELALAGLSGLWTVTAAYRAFRARSLEAFIFLLGAVFVLMRYAPVGGAIWIGFPIVGGWIIYQPFTAMLRALVIAGGIGIIAYAARFYMGKERQAFGMRG